MTALGRFTFHVGAKRQGDVVEDTGALQLRLVGRTSATDSATHEVLLPSEYAAEQPVTLPFTLENLPTDGTDGESAVYQYEAILRTDFGGIEVATFWAPADGETVEFSDHLAEPLGPPDTVGSVLANLLLANPAVRAALVEALSGLDIGGGLTPEELDDAIALEVTARNTAIGAAIDALKGSAPAAYDTLVEIAAKLDALDDEDDVLTAMLATLDDKVDEGDLDDLIGILAATPGSDVKALLDGKASTGALTTAISNEVTARNAAITAAINALVNGAPGALDTLNELATQMTADEGAAATLTALVGAVRNLTDPTHVTALNGAYVRGLRIAPGVGGVVGNGTGDDTAAMQAILNQVSTANGVVDVYIAAGTYMIDGVNETVPPDLANWTKEQWAGGGLLPKTGTRLHLASGAVLKVITNGSPAYSVIHLLPGVSDVQIRGGQILGDRSTHDYATEPTYTTHEYGYGISMRAANDVLIEGVRISGCTGDCVYVGNTGRLDTNDYVPSNRVTVRRCTLDGARRNNLSVIGGDTITVEGCTITNAGTNDGVHDGTAPRLGIDLEANFSGTTALQSVTNVVIRGNKFTGNVSGSVANFNGKRVLITGNHADTTMSYSFGNETVIDGNVVINTSSTTTPGITCNSGGSLTYKGNVVRGNIIKGFQYGIQISNEDVVVEGNDISGFLTAGVNVFLATHALVVGNLIADGGASSVGVNVAQSTITKVSGNTIRNVATGVLVATTSTGITIDSNTVTKTVTGFNIGAGCQAVVRGNNTDLAGNSGGQSYDVNYASTSLVLIEGNIFRNSSTYSISGASGVSGKSRIIGNRIIDSASTVQFNLSGGRHEVIGNTFIINRTSGTNAPIVLAGTSDKSMVMGNVAYNSSTAAYTYLVSCSGSAVTNTRVVGNTIVGPATVINGDAGTPVTADNNLVAA